MGAFGACPDGQEAVTTLMSAAGPWHRVRRSRDPTPPNRISNVGRPCERIDTPGRPPSDHIRLSHVRAPGPSASDGRLRSEAMILIRRVFLARSGTHPRCQARGCSTCKRHRQTPPVNCRCRDHGSGVRRGRRRAQGTMRTDDTQGNDAPDPTGRCTAKGASQHCCGRHQHTPKTPLVVTYR